MLLQNLYRNITFFSLASILAGTTIVQIAAQDPSQRPAQKPESKPANQEKSAAPDKSDKRIQNPIDILQKELMKNARSNSAEKLRGIHSEDQLEEFSNEAIKIDTELVQLDVTVIDQNNKPVYGLKKEDFTVYEDKVKQVLENVSTEEIPISFGIVVDTSGSMRPKLQTVSDAALSLIKQKRQDDEGFIAQFKTESEIIQEFTTDESDLEYAVGQFFTSGGTSLLDAIISASDYAQQKGKRRRKAIIVISDGLEQNSKIKENEVIDAIKENEVQLYLVDFVRVDELSTLVGQTPAMKAKELLLRLAEDSGGRAFFPTDTSEIPAIAAQIAKDLRTQYIVSYYPTKEKRDGTYRSIRVDINPQGGQKMIGRARQGYYANPDKESKQSEVVK